MFASRSARSPRFSWVLSTFAAVVVSQACAHRADDCDANSRCPVAGDTNGGSNSAGTASDAGGETGGSSSGKGGTSGTSGKGGNTSGGSSSVGGAGASGEAGGGGNS